MSDSKGVRFIVSKPVTVDDGLSSPESERDRATTAPVKIDYHHLKYEPSYTPPGSPPDFLEAGHKDSRGSHKDSSRLSEGSRFMGDSFSNDMPEQGIHPLFPDEESHRPKVTRALRSLSIYNPILPGSSDAEKKQRKSAAESIIDVDLPDDFPRGAQMGTLMGVYLPCIQNILGVLFFIRLTWIVGMAGTAQSFFVVLICCTVTFLTSISLSAIATNGIVPGGGPYYMISRNLGPELGGAVGVLFYLGTSIAGAMYIIGAVEIFIIYLVPQAKIFDDSFMCFRLFGTIFLILIGCIVLAGVRVVNKFALPAVCIVVLCILLTFVGVFVNFNGKPSLQYCMVGDRVANLMKWADQHGGVKDVEAACNSSYLAQLFCEANGTKCDPYFEAMRNANKVGPQTGISGIASGVISDNGGSKYSEKGQLLFKNMSEEPVLSENTSPYYVMADLSTSFMILIGVFFPSVTGIMAGSNRSGDLKDASLSIPRGTIAATISTSCVYLFGVILFGASIDSVFIRDKYGEGAYGRLVIAELAVPHYVVILLGCFLSTVGAGMQSLTGAPRLLQAIAKDGVVPILAPFQTATKRGEPVRAVLLTLCICEVGILIAQLESITALITQFFLMCYLSVNGACALQSLLNAPGWRPGFKYYHWSLSMFGAVLCIAVMFISHWWFAFVAIAIGVVVYKYIEFRGAEKEWGDGIRGLSMSAARYALLNVEDKTPHTRNWRPQLLVLTASDLSSESERHDRLLSFVCQLKAGKGLTVLSSVIEGDFIKCAEHSEEVKERLREDIKRHKIRGFCDVLICRNKKQGITSLIQTSGLGAMRHNTIVLPWPDAWQEKDDPKHIEIFVETVRVASAARCALLVPKNIGQFPLTHDKLTGYMDIWWIVHDGGMLMLLPFLLRQHRVWRRSHLRIFTVAQVEDNTPKMKEDLKTFLYHLRINAEIDVIEMFEADISEYTYERTLKMEERHKMLRNLQLSGKQKARDVQSAVMDQTYQIRKLSQMNEQRRLSQVKEERSASTTGEEKQPAIPSVTVSQPQDVESVPTSPESPEDDPENQPLINEQDKQYQNQARYQVSSIPDKKKTQSSHKENGPSVTFSPDVHDNEDDDEKEKNEKKYHGLKAYNVRRMHTAVRLNEAIRSKSADAQMIIVNLPGPPKHSSDQFYMEFVEALTEGLDRVLLVKGCGTEVVTIYS